MNSKVKLTGGSYFDKGDPVWSGELPLLTAGAGIKVMVSKGDAEFLFSVTGVCVELSGPDSWQVVYVLPADKNTERLLTEAGRGSDK